MKTCPRCLKKLIPHSVHTCTPTTYARKLETELEQLRLIAAGARDPEALVSELHSQLDALGARLAGVEATAHGLKLERDALATIKESLTVQNATLSARVEALEGAIGGYVLSSIRAGALDNLMQILNSTPAADLSAHDEAVRRDALEQAWKRYREIDELPYHPTWQEAKDSIFSIPSTETPQENQC